MSDNSISALHRHHAPGLLVGVVLSLIGTQVANAQVAQRGRPEFKWSGSISPLKSRCFSEVCLGDDVSKLIALKLPWLAEEATSTNRNDQQTKPSGQFLQELTQKLSAAFRGLTPVQVTSLIAALSRGSGSNPEFDNYSALIPTPRGGYLVMSGSVLTALKSATPCAVLPVHGVFKSESGYYTSVLLTAEKGKLTVTRLVRQWSLPVPSNASDAQQSKVLLQELQDLFKQVNDTYGNAWFPDTYNIQPVESMAVSDDSVAYLHWSNPRYPRLTLYARPFAAFQDHVYDSRGPEPDRQRSETKINWRTMTSFVNSELSTQSGCEFKPTAVGLN